MSLAPLKTHFDGVTYDHARDGARLTSQLERVWNVMKDGKPRTLGLISEQTGDPQASISARLRDLRKMKFGGHTIARAYIGAGLYQYILVRNVNSNMDAIFDAMASTHAA